METTGPRCSQKRLDELQKSTAEVGESVHRTTTGRALHTSGLYGRLATRMLLLKENHKIFYLQFAKSQWKMVLWSDATKIKLSDVNAKHYVWHKYNTEDNYQKTPCPLSTMVVAASNSMFWGAFLQQGQGGCQSFAKRKWAKICL